MRARTAVLLAVAAAGAGYALWRVPATRRFVATVRTASAEREAELRAAVETAVREDATTRAPRHANGIRTPDLEVDAGWDRRGSTRDAAPTSTPLGADDPGRSLTPEEARALLLDPTGERAPRGH